MAQRSKEQWKTLIEEHRSSGLSADTFCKEQGINPGYFSTVKYKLKQMTAKSTGFVRVKPLTQDSPGAIIIERGDLVLKLPITTKPDWIADLMRSLAL